MFCKISNLAQFFKALFVCFAAFAVNVASGNDAPPPEAAKKTRVELEVLPVENGLELRKILVGPVGEFSCGDLVKVIRNTEAFTVRPRDFTISEGDKSLTISFFSGRFANTNIKGGVSAHDLLILDRTCSLDGAEVARRADDGQFRVICSNSTKVRPDKPIDSAIPRWLYITVENKTKLSDVITVASQLKIEPFAKTFLILRGEGLRGL